MYLNRRQFLTSSSLAVAAAGMLRGRAFGRQTPPPAVPQFFDLRGGVGYFTARGGTIGWYAGADGIVVVDTQFPDTAEMAVNGLKSKSAVGFDTLINTHHHRDHTGGNIKFRPVVKRIVAHANVPELQRKQAAANNAEAEQAYPDVTFADAWKMSIGQETISARHYGRGHTGGDIVVHFEKADVVHMGDLMFNRTHPAVDRPAGASLANWITTLEQVAAAHGAQTTFIFGHAHEGYPVTGSGSDLLKLRDYLTAVLALVRKEKAAGKTREEVEKIGAVPGFEYYGPRLPRVLTTAFDEITEEA